MHIKKNFIFIISIFCLLALSGCNQRPSPQEVAQLILDINSCNYLAVSVGHSPWWDKIPYTSITNILNVGGHFVLGNLNNSITYNPDYNGSLPYKYYNEVMLYEK